MRYKRCNDENYERNCPVMDIHDRLNECYFHIFEMSQFYHIPAFFRYSLNAFLSSIQSLKYLIKSKANEDSFVNDIFHKCFDNFDEDRLFIKRMFDSRNEVVHEHNLRLSSTAIVGLYRDKSHKMGISFPATDVFENSALILKRMIPVFVGQLGFLDERHSAIGEEIGVEREWIVDSISKNEILSECLVAFDYMSSVVGEIHHIYKKDLVVSTIDETALLKCKVITESDLDPSLPKQWGWVD
ncbi:MAG: hypothetical protein BWY97_01371 [Tenericutes bacterium ADurb.BinA124]|nr:MAG: hypothetical protein BWY97_01371 [Tenericutes bacterium ADurb.BinA124]